jgi:ATP-dependent DNA helicase RecG
MTMNIFETFNNLRYRHENEVVEFKKAENSFSFDELGKYFSALSNEANLRDKGFAWLVFGVHDKAREILGTSYKNSMKSLQKLKYDLSQHTTDGNTFRDIFELEVEGKRVLMFQIPAAPRGIPLAGTLLCPTWREFGGSRHEQV